MFKCKSSSFLCNTTNHTYLNNIHSKNMKRLLEVYDSILYKHKVTLCPNFKYSQFNMFLNATLVSDSAKLANINKEVAEMVKQGQFEDLGHKFLTWGVDLSLKVLTAFIIFFIGRWIIKRLSKVIDKLTTKQKMDSTLKGFLGNTLNVFLYIFLIIVIINIVGAKSVSLAALIGSAGLAIGLAVKDNLSNFAGGVMLLFNKPFKVGDYIEVQSQAGTVRNIGILYTMLTTSDFKTIYIPNGPLSTGTIVNISRQPRRRIEIVVSLEYGTDVEVAKSLLLEIAHNHPKVFKDPAPFARMAVMGDNSIDFKLRVWTKSSDFWDVTFDLNEEIYKQLNERGLNIPFQQLTVHVEK